jgi:hypothetical protein
MTLWLKDDAGRNHPVKFNVRPDDEELIFQAKRASTGIDGWPPIMARVGKSKKLKAL